MRLTVSPAVYAQGVLFPFWSCPGVAQTLQCVCVLSLKSVQFSSGGAVSWMDDSSMQKWHYPAHDLSDKRGVTLPLHADGLHGCQGVRCVPSLIADINHRGHRMVVIIVSGGRFVRESASSVTYGAHRWHAFVEKGALPSWPCVHLLFSPVGFLFRLSPFLSWTSKNPTKTKKWSKLRMKTMKNTNC